MFRNIKRFVITNLRARKRKSDLENLSYRFIFWFLIKRNSIPVNESMIHVIRKMMKVSISFRVLSFFDIILFTIYYLSYHLANLFRIFSRQFPQMSHDLELQTSWTISNLLRTLLWENFEKIRCICTTRNNWIKILS